MVRMDKGDVEMVDAEKNIPASDILVFNEYPINYENGVKTKGLIGITNLEDKMDDQSNSKGVDLMNVKSKTKNQLNCKSQSETLENVVSEEKTVYLAHKLLNFLKMK